ncbi:Predicted nucleic acid-binding protein, contains PIN domain [Methylomagnum ishizawai]|uniref:Predicted nucleic acid-binding protein, contains PIN domain n=1 Tax=Methylomagnum ishizawai TaxID=1760988 RepID=A0A1Y6D7Z5_9GAMM|nr:type II toxin-antitoxin system VapC family toxin [Methylomagnum ishizawai]SMF96394.1 Predicted nucleic acid-binding protein, contains PIN domain [Methylomagnum ishizawai]
MNVVDSSGWLEYFAEGPNVEFFAPAIEDTRNLIVPSISLYEVFKRVLIQTDEARALRAVALMQEAQVIDLNSSLAVYAAQLSYRYKTPMADSIILATAWTHQAILWTQDNDFEGLPKVNYIRKP